MLCFLICGSQRAVRLPASFLSLYYLRIPRYSHHAFRTLGLLRALGHISGPKRPLLVKTIQITISQVYLHKLRRAGIKSLIPKQ